MTMKKLPILLAAIALSVAAMAQKVTVNSTVKSTDGQPVKGAIVSVIGEKSAALTDEHGQFNLQADKEKVLVSIKAEGFYALEVPMTRLIELGKHGHTVLILVPSSSPLYASSDGTVEQKDFSEKLSVGAALRDGIAGLQVIEKSGMVGEGSYMNVRGIHSFVADNSPLIVVNGVPFLGTQAMSGIINAYSRDQLLGYDPKDIRSVNVLSGAATAAYGSLGSNGVVLIETQQATSDNLNTRMTYSGSYGLNIAKKSIPMLNAAQYKSYMKDAGLSLYPTMEALRNDYPFLNNGAYSQAYLFNEDINWMKEITRNGFVTENLFRVEGGDEIAKYNIAFGYTGNRGTINNTSQDRYHTLISANVLASKQCDIFANVGLAYITSNLQEMGMQQQTNPMLAALRTMPLISAYEKQTDGTPLPNYANYNFWNTSASPLFNYQNVSNPLAVLNTVEAKDKIYDVNTQVGINFRWNKYLTITGLLNIYYNYTEETLFVPGINYPRIMPQFYGAGLNKVGNSVAISDFNTYTFAANYSRLFNDVHNVNARLTARSIDRTYKVDLNEGFNTVNDETKNLGEARDGLRSWGDDTQWKYLSATLVADYTYNKMLRADLSFAVDGSSVTGLDAPRWGLFPAANITAMLANILELPSSVNALNLNIGASKSGNSRFASNYGKSYYSGQSYFAIGSIVRDNMPNRQLSWERKSQIDFGLKGSLLNNRLDIGMNYFYSHAYDLLLNDAVSSVYGSKAFYDNLGTINTNGFETFLRVNPLHTKDWDVVVGLSASNASSVIKSLGEVNEFTLTYTGLTNDDAKKINRVGEKPYEFYGYQTNGIYITTAEATAAGLTNAAGIAYEAGDVRFVDQNNDNVINDYDKVLLGSTMPTLFGALNLSVTYKRFVLDADFGYTLGNKVYNATRRQLESMDNFYNQSAATLNRWVVEEQQTNIPRAFFGDPHGNNVFSDRWIEKGDYVKLRHVKLSYNYSKLFNFINSGNIYLAAENLFTVTNYLGADPEFAFGYDEAMRGIDCMKATLPMSVKVGFNINF